MYQFSDKRNTFDFLDSNVPKNEFLGRKFKNLSLDSESAFLRYYVHQFSEKANNFEFRAQICPKMDFGVGISKI